jgi:transcriptional antiterminator RfaH
VPSYWTCARVQAQREALAVHSLSCAGYWVYLPRLRERKRSYGRWIERQPVLCPGDLFVEIVAGWWQARWCPGVLTMIMDHDVPARVPDEVIAEIRSRERGGLVELPRPSKFRAGDRVRVLHGPFIGLVGLYAGMKPRERVEVLLAILGGAQRVTLAKDAVEAV